MADWLIDWLPVRTFSLECLMLHSLSGLLILMTLLIKNNWLVDWLIDILPAIGSVCGAYAGPDQDLGGVQQTGVNARDSPQVGAHSSH